MFYFFEAVSESILQQTPRTPHGKKAPRFFPVMKETAAPDPASPRKRKTRHSENPPQEGSFGWVIDAADHPVATVSSELPIPEDGLASYGSTPVVTNFQHPSHELLQDNGFVWHVYHKYRARYFQKELHISSHSINT